MGSISPKAKIMEEMESITVSVEVNGRSEFRIVDKVEIGKWDLPKLVPRLFPGEKLVETSNGYKILRRVGFLTF